MKKEEANLTKREYLQPSIALHAIIEETPLLESTTLDIDKDEFNEKDWDDKDLEGGTVEI